MRNDYYFDDLEIENFFIEDQTISGVVPTRPGLVNTKPEDSFQKTGFRNDPLMKPIKLNVQPFTYYDDPYNADGKLKDKLKKFAQSEKGKKILKIYAAVGIAAVLIAAGPAILSALAPVLPAMKALLAKKGIQTKGMSDVVKKFTETQIKLEGDEKKDPKKIIKGILGFFKGAKDRRAAGTASPLDEFVLKTADETVQKISDGTLSVENALELETAPAKTPGKGTTKEAATEKKGFDMKLILVILVAVFFLTKK
jgi:hypothetical protein